MSKLAGHMAFYAAYHRHPHNKLTHFFGVPTIVFSLLLAMSALRMEVAGQPVTLAMAFVAVMTVYYISLDALIGVTVGLLTLPFLWLADLVSQMETGTAVGIGVAAFVIGWAIQLLGHKFEGNKPALLQNIFQIFVAPLFLTTELFFALGLRKQLEGEVDRLVAGGIGGVRA
ncbi:DUF962 domain-containing protein [Oleisolibacter albus]|uniref:Mpo1 family 2-hydroxy fatty acid dioxygenase n=1 Tax=Oleisolibacter albus TaxID=2171757 RepID=UPI000DF3E7C0|nr:Mpo1-like protein [Oleisolibacter albus]